MTGAQSRAARALLGWSEADLAARTGLAEDVLRAFEAGHGDPAAGQVEAARSALMAAGVVFSEAPSLGVRLDPARRGGRGEGSGGSDEGTRLADLTTENDR